MGLNQCKLSKADELNEAELSALVAATEMSRSEIIKWHKGFMADCPSGRLTKSELITIYEQLFTSGRAKRFCDLVYRVFDKKNTNTIGISNPLLGYFKRILMDLDQGLRLGLGFMVLFQILFDYLAQGQDLETDL